jgi:hypothetical protein
MQVDEKQLEETAESVYQGDFFSSVVSVCVVNMANFATLPLD